MIAADISDYYSRFLEIARYVDWSEEDSARILAAKPLVEPAFGAMVDDFYGAIQQTPAAMGVITGGETQIQRLKSTLLDWIDQMFGGSYDETYVIRRLRVGTRHVELGLDQIFVNSAMARLRQRINDAVMRGWDGGREELVATMHSINRMLDLDLALIQDAYQMSFTKMHKSMERYATIGKISGGIAHEVRNPLNVMKTSVYFLQHANEATPQEKIEKHLARIGAAVEDANQIVSALSEFARLPTPALNALSIRQIVSEALEKSRLVAEPRAVRISLECTLADDRVLGESAQLLIAFGNLIRNAFQAVDADGEIRIRICEINGKKSVVIRDNGAGIKKEDLSRIADPLFSTKPKGLGLGLAITKAILDSHKAELNVESEPGVGSEFQVSFPLREATIA